jgi:hypothetical protein
MPWLVVNELEKKGRIAQFLTFPVTITTFTPLDKASFNAYALIKEIKLLLFSNVHSNQKRGKKK